MSTPKRSKIIAVIPYYASLQSGSAMAASLRHLLGQVTQTHDAVVVMDDASPDRQIDKVMAEFGDAVLYVKGEQNRGAGGNRNRILEVAEAKDFSRAILHFIDADTSLADCSQLPAVVHERFSDLRCVAVFGLIFDKAGQQLVWNYGQRETFYTLISTAMQVRLERLLTTNPRRAAAFRKRYAFLLKGQPNPLEKPQLTKVFWGAEGNMLMRFRDFAELGGFDAQMRYHEILELMVRFSGARPDCYALFDPRFQVTHPGIDVRHETRKKEIRDARLHHLRKHGVGRYFWPRKPARP